MYLRGMRPAPTQKVGYLSILYVWDILGTSTVYSNCCLVLEKLYSFVPTEHGDASRTHIPLIV